jgi:hypothetical protein
MFTVVRGSRRFWRDPGLLQGSLEIDLDPSSA